MAGYSVVLLYFIGNFLWIINARDQYLSTEDKYWLSTDVGDEFDSTKCTLKDDSDLVSLHSLQDVNDLVHLIKRYQNQNAPSYIGLMVDSCYDNHNYTLKWYDNTPMDYSLIPWCDGQPGLFEDLCDSPYIAFDATNKCIFNCPFNGEWGSYACGNPRQC